MDKSEFWYHNFEPVPPAPTFEPTEEEFKDSLAYIAKIKPIAENYGVVKIKPPPSWQPPFAIDVDRFTFTPRLQKLNELEAVSRIRLNFIARLARFWHLQGSVLKVPLVDTKYLDLYKLHKKVESEGGYDVCVGERKWPLVSRRLGHKPTHGAQLKAHYHRLLRPFDLYQTGQALEHATGGEQTLAGLKAEHDQQQRLDDATAAAAAVITLDDDEEEGKAGGRYAAAPVPKTRMRLTPREIRQVKSRMSRPTNRTEDVSQGRRKKQGDPIDSVYCMTCKKGDNEEKLLLCDQCDDSYHTFCLLPPLSAVPKGDWRCPQCVTEEVTKPTEGYGFEQAPRAYSLKEFGDLADAFKRDYFGMACHMVPGVAVEREFWRQVVEEQHGGRRRTTADDDDDPAPPLHGAAASSSGGGLAVMYGADLFTEEVGSGFPRESDAHLDDADRRYVTDSWNLNKLPVQRNSVLSHITSDISGMMVPWAYVGQCFSTFCWHTEDHWSYSINYLHWGESKHWYGVSGRDADRFERSMCEMAPELFESQPDLLHHIVTIMNPRLLMDKGVPVHCVTQDAGEFVITFPRSYHAGFNTGFNFAEAVNFCPADWLTMGRQCVDHYSEMRRSCVFSHDELLCNMAGLAESLDIPMAITTYRDLLKMIEVEKDRRKSLLTMGVRESKKELFELVNDDHRQCVVCSTTLYMSALTCPCDPNRLVCLKHVDKLCKDCPPKKFCLRYRYTLDELPPLLKGLLEKTKRFDDWVTAVNGAVAAKGQQRIECDELKSLLDEAKQHRYPQCETFGTLAASVKHAERCAVIADQLIAHKIRTRTRQNGLSNYAKKLKLEEVEAFSDQIDKLVCRIPQATAIAEFVTNARQFLLDTKAVLGDGTDGRASRDSDPETRLDTVRRLFERAVAFDLQLPELLQLKDELEKSQWICAVDRISNIAPQERKAHTDTTDDDTVATKCKSPSDSKPANATVVATATVDRLKQLITDGINLPGDSLIEARIARLQHLLETAEQNENKASALLKQSTGGDPSTNPHRPRLTEAQQLLARLHPLPSVRQTAVEQLRMAVTKATDWLDNCQESQALGTTLTELDHLIGQAKWIPLDLEPTLDQLKTTRRQVDRLLGAVEEIFQKFPCYYSTGEILSPRLNISGLVEGQKCPLFPHRQRSRHEEWTIVDQYQSCEEMLESLEKKSQQESLLLLKLRQNNAAKQPAEEDGPTTTTTEGPGVGMAAAEDRPSTEAQPDRPNSATVNEASSSLSRPGGESAFAPPLSVSVPTVSPVKSEHPPDETGSNRITDMRAASETGSNQITAKTSVVTEVCLCRRTLPSAAGKRRHDENQLLRCRLCAELYHVECVSWDPALASLSGRYLCQRCCKGKRPPIERVSALLATTKSQLSSSSLIAQRKTDTPKTPQRMIALEESLVKRCIDLAEAWQNEARAFLKLPGVRELWTQHQQTEQQVPDLNGKPIASLPKTQLENLERLILSGLNMEVTVPELSTLFEAEDFVSSLQHSKQTSVLDTLRLKPAVSPTFELPYSSTSKGGTGPDTASGPGGNGRKRAGGGRHPGGAHHTHGSSQGGSGKKTRQVSYHDDDQKCSAEYCLQPIGDEVNWVQCEAGCDQWFHIVCVGLTVQSVTRLDSYECYRCVDAQHTALTARRPVTAVE